MPYVLQRKAADHWEPWTLPASICWRLTYLRFLSSIRIPGAAITHLDVHRSCRWVDAFKSPPTKCSEDWDPLVSYKSSNSSSLRVGRPTDFGTPSLAVGDLGIHLDSDMSMSSHAHQEDSVDLFHCAEAASCHSCRSVSRPVVQSLVTSLVLSRLDYGNATLAGIPQHLLRRRQSVMNAAARLIYSSSRFDHITPLFRQLHWLKAKERIDFKLSVLVFKCVHGSAPPYSRRWT